MNTIRRSVVTFILGALCVQPVYAEQGRRASKEASPVPGAKAPGSAPPATPEPLPQAKVVPYNSRDVVPVRTRVRFVTLIVLPDGEEILEIACGDKDFWAINGTQNLAYVKPAQEGIKTNLNIVTASGRIYSFLLSEASGAGAPEPDLKVVIEPREGTSGSGTIDVAAAADAPRQTARVMSSDGTQKLVSIRAFEELRREVQAAQDETRKVRESAQEAATAAANAAARKLVSNMRFAYRFEAGRKPFNVRAMGHDERFTYIHARPEETPTLYETKDGKPNLVSFDYEDGVFVVSKILGSGYLAIGKERLRFEREE